MLSNSLTSELVICPDISETKIMEPVPTILQNGDIYPDNAYTPLVHYLKFYLDSTHLNDDEISLRINMAEICKERQTCRNEITVICFYLYSLV